MAVWTPPSPREISLNVCSHRGADELTDLIAWLALQGHRFQDRHRNQLTYMLTPRGEVSFEEIQDGHENGVGLPLLR